MAFRRRGRVLLAWLAALAIAFGLSAAFGGEFTADYSAPGSDSKQAQDLLAQRFPVRAGESVDVVVRADAAVTDPVVRAEVATLLDELAGLPHVTAADDPYASPGGVSPDGHTLLARLSLDVAIPADMPVADTERLLGAAEAASRPGLEVALGGQVIQEAEANEVGSEGIGLLVAAVILLVMFGTVVAAGLPIGVAVAGLAVSGVLTGLVTALFDVPNWAPILGSMLGIALGIDYALLMVTRFREWRAAGLDPEAATVATMDTAGRAVLVAGGTVMVSMLGLFAMGLAFMRGRRRHDGGRLRGAGRVRHALPRATGLPGQVDRPAARAAGAAAGGPGATGGRLGMVGPAGAPASRGGRADRGGGTARPGHTVFGSQLRLPGRRQRR
ncbi:MMPL family transporter [Phytohabitans flavus]|uniref:MMPL family transporter n=1 Tax=Phytohabitans flavus TaxID=1076124 RepID=UPI00363740CB